MEEMEDRREKRREQVSFEWCETIRQAGELYRDLEDIESVSEEVEHSEEDVREALTVYRLIFEEPPTTVSTKVASLGQAFFTVGKDVEEAAETIELDEPVEQILREYVGTVYLDYEVEDESVGDPVERTAPSFPLDIDTVRETIEESITPPTKTYMAASGMDSLLEPMIQSQASLVQTVTQPVLNQQVDVLQSALSPTLAHINRQHQAILEHTTESLIQSLPEIQFPAPVIADLASLHPANAGTATGTSPSPQASTVAEASPTTAEITPTEASNSSTTSINGATGTTVDATLPDQDAFSTELVFEIPALVAESILNTGQARTWFTSLSQDYQIMVLRFMLFSITLHLTGNPVFAAMASFLAPYLRRRIVTGEE